ncbi:MAG: YheV family putative metal-binding protein [Oceanospirillaceae bacterium]|nr:YheV family putative metal-binding protein [Oceanospirillaceae bacterium]
MTIVKRFMAGAVCPRCAQMDTTRMYRDEEREYRECVDCGFEDSMRLDGRPEPKELETRVSKDGVDPLKNTPATEPEAQPIKFFVNPKLQKKDH